MEGKGGRGRKMEVAKSLAKDMLPDNKVCCIAYRVASQHFARCLTI